MLEQPVPEQQDDRAQLYRRAPGHAPVEIQPSLADEEADTASRSGIARFWRFQRQTEIGASGALTGQPP